jgi:hypothetical protein
MRRRNSERMYSTAKETEPQRKTTSAALALPFLNVQSESIIFHIFTANII